ncbi:MAG: Holliday junction resolvase RuvX [Alphaproteobacteria bacterium]|nr:Holliday junction resolvase RuvX [Alphaproteobacteria bacterium]
MPLVSLFDLPPRGALLGLDPGAKTVGVAACDPGRIIASPLETIPRGKKLAPVLTRLFALYDGRSCAGLVMGLPVNMNGTEGPRAQSARALVRSIIERRDIPVALWDERLSTAAVERAMIAADTSRARREEMIDKLAAAWILQGAIDRLHEHKA